MDSEIYKQLTRIAFERTIPFCYSCYAEAISGTCTRCGSDDLMRLLPEVGCEYGTEWEVRSILESEIESADLDAAFEEFVRECYPETTQVGWLSLDTADTLKAKDLVAWRCAQSDWESSEESDERIISFDGGSTYYWMHDLESLVSRGLD